MTWTITPSSWTSSSPKKRKGCSWQNRPVETPGEPLGWSGKSSWGVGGHTEVKAQQGFLRQHVRDSEGVLPEEGGWLRQLSGGLVKEVLSAGHGGICHALASVLSAWLPLCWLEGALGSDAG